MTGEAPNPKRPEDFLHLDFQAGGVDWTQKRRPLAVAVAIHVAVFVLLAIPFTRKYIVGEPMLPGEVLVRFYEMAGEGPGGGGGGGGSGGRRPTAFIRTRIEPDPEEPRPEPRRAAIAPRQLPRLKFDDLDVPDLPTETDVLFGTVFSPDAVEFPGLSLVDGTDYGGLDTEPSSGSGGGIGGGQGTGVGTGEGWGVGPGRGGGFGGGEYRPGSWDIDPVLVYKPDDPAYPPRAKEKLIAGEVILEILVKLDGSTQVRRVLKSLPYCVDAAVENAKLYRWKPALEKGEPVEAVGIITITFNLFAREKKRKG